MISRQIVAALGVVTMACTIAAACSSSSSTRDRASGKAGAAGTDGSTDTAGTAQSAGGGDHAAGDSSAAAGADTARICAPGATQLCVCSGSSEGAQVCAASGTRWEACDCGQSGSAGADGGGGPGGGGEGAAGQGGASEGVAGQGGLSEGDAGQGGRSGGLAGHGGEAGTAGGSSVIEDCLNGIDDNGDELADCDDPLCQERGFLCVARPPDNWLGVGWLGEVERECPPSLPASVPLHRLEALNAPPPQCQCSCGEPGGGECSALLSCYGQGACDDPTVQSTTTVLDTCTELLPPTGYSGDSTLHCQIDSLALANAGSALACEAESSMSLLDPTWPPAAQACLGNEGGACESDGLVCVPRSSPELVGPCVVRPGEHPCPPPYEVGSLYFDGRVEDSRGCTPCACGDVEDPRCVCNGPDGNCGVLVQDAACESDGVMVPLGGSCTPVPRTDSGSIMMGAMLVGVRPGGDCAPSVPAPVGEVVPLGPLTVCCVN